MIRFKIFGVKINFSFLLLSFLVWVLLYNKNNITFICLYSAMFHEIIHILFLVFFSIKIESISFKLFDISIKKGAYSNFKQELIVLVSGSFGNLFLFLLFLYLNLKTASFVNLILFTFNMLPHKKLDGGQIFSEIIYRRLDANLATKVVDITSLLVVIFAVFIVFVPLMFYKTFFALYALALFMNLIFKF